MSDPTRKEVLPLQRNELEWPSWMPQLLNGLSLSLEDYDEEAHVITLCHLRIRDGVLSATEESYYSPDGSAPNTRKEPNHASHQDRQT